MPELSYGYSLTLQVFQDECSLPSGNQDDHSLMFLVENPSSKQHSVLLLHKTISLGPAYALRFHGPAGMERKDKLKRKQKSCSAR